MPAAPKKGNKNDNYQKYYGSGKTCNQAYCYYNN